jgi:DNA mismatch repair protein MutS
MVEMSEVANIVNNATERSFIILDEVGRGTSTFDGISIASAITEYIHDNIKAKTIFATHYHELTDLEYKLKGAVNYRIEVLENEKDVVFLREIRRGGADKSYGIEVARLAGLPKNILQKSKTTLRKLEERQRIIEKSVKGEQLALFSGRVLEEPEIKEEIIEMTKGQKEAIDYIENLNLDKLTPIEALMALDKLKKML